MGRRDYISSLAILLLAGIACGFAQLDTSDDFGTSSYGLRRLSAFYSRDFAAHFPAKCYQSSYFSPFRMYFKSFNLTTESSTFIYQLDVSACPFPKADCCRLPLDHMVVRTRSDIQVTAVRLDGVEKPISVSAIGLTIKDLNVDPSKLKSMMLEIVTPGKAYNYPRDMCPVSRYPESCDVISYDANEVCCAERAALPYELLFPVNQPPTSINRTDNAPPPLEGYKAPPPPPSPPPPPPDGWDHCCIDDLPKSPYNLKYQGFQQTGSDTAYKFQLVVRKLNYSYPDFDGPEPGDCGQMNLRDMGVAIYDNLLIKSVQFNGTVMDYWTEAQGSLPDAKWVYVNLFKELGDFDEEVPIDYVITVRGKVDSLCPANEFLHSPAACEFAFHGKDDLTHCCPHGATRRGGPVDECCVDDLEKAPYRIDYVKSVLNEPASTYDFFVKVVNVTGLDFDLEEPARCDHMTLDYAQIQIYKHVEVVQVMWEERIMSFNTTPATDYANWLNVNGINRFINDFDPNMPVRLKITVEGFVRELCPAGWLLDAGGAVMCEYVLHGTQGDESCCPHGVTRVSAEPSECGCRDDLPGTPYRLGYQPSGVTPLNESLFNFDLGKVDPAAAIDYDGAPDKNFGVDVECGSMGLKSITFVINKNVMVKAVIFNGFNYSFQYEPYTSTSKWLRVLELGYTSAELPSTPVHLTVVTEGAVSEMCPAASKFGSQASCEYRIYGLSSSKDQCCPAGVTSWFSPKLLGITRR